MSDALNRFWRTVLQGLVLTAVVAAGDYAYNAFTGGETDWRIVARGAGFAAGMAVLSYAHRKYVDPSPIPSLTPPAPAAGS